LDETDRREDLTGVKLGILGDYYAAPRLAAPPAISERLSERLGAADHVIVNFEAPLAQPTDVKAFKTGPNIRQHPEALGTLARGGITDISIANNHSWDFGSIGRRRTVDEARHLGIGVCGLTIDGQAKPLEFSHNGLRVCVLAFAEHEWCGPAGASPSICVIDPIFMARSLERVRGLFDAVIVLLHANNEYHQLPSPALVDQAEFLVEQGASAVLVHHAHVISGSRQHLGRPIFYGLGNFQFAMASPTPDFYEGLYVELTIGLDADGKLSITHQIEPIVTNPVDYAVDLASGETAGAIIREFAALSLLLESPAALDASYAEFLERSTPMYREMLNPWISRGRLLRLLGRLGVKFWLRRPENYAVLLNAMRCESHRGALIRLLSEKAERER
jgi:poly-gamma-glutamate synthesis protein (capsule biosynthesis protein)